MCPIWILQAASRPGLLIPEIPFILPLPLPLLRMRGGEGDIGGPHDGDGVLGGDEGGEDNGDGVLEMVAAVDSDLGLSIGRSGMSGLFSRGLRSLILLGGVAVAATLI